MDAGVRDGNPCLSHLVSKSASRAISVQSSSSTANAAAPRVCGLMKKGRVRNLGRLRSWARATWDLFLVRRDQDDACTCVLLYSNDFAEQITTVSGKSVVKTVRISSGRGSGGGRHETSACIRHISEHSGDVPQ